MKKISIALILSVVFTISYAQRFTNESSVVNVGLGLGTTLYTGSYYSLRVPPVSVSYEKGVYEKTGPGYFGLGGFFGIAGSHYEVTYFGGNYGADYTYIVAGLRGLYHIDLVEVLENSSMKDFDVYGGFQLNIVYSGVRTFGTFAGYSVSSSTGVDIAAFIGSRYYFNDKFAAFGEIGYNISYLTIGLSVKLQ